MTLGVRLNPPTAQRGTHRYTQTGQTRASANDSKAEKTRFLKKETHRRSV